MTTTDPGPWGRELEVRRLPADSEVATGRKALPVLATSQAVPGGRMIELVDRSRLPAR